MPAGDTYADRVFRHSGSDSDRILPDGTFMGQPPVARCGTVRDRRLTACGYLEQGPEHDNLHGLGAFLPMYGQARRAPRTVRPRACP